MHVYVGAWCTQPMYLAAWRHLTPNPSLPKNFCVHVFCKLDTVGMVIKRWPARVGNASCPGLKPTLQLQARAQRRAALQSQAQRRVRMHIASTFTILNDFLKDYFELQFSSSSSGRRMGRMGRISFEAPAHHHSNRLKAHCKNT